MPTSTTVTPLPSTLAGAKVLIVGGASGTGAAATRLLADLGAHVLVASRTGALPPDLPDATRSQIRAVAADMLDEDSLAAALQGEDLDHVLVTAAEIVAPGPVLEQPYADVEATLAGWIRGSYQVARATAGRLPSGGSLTFFSGHSAVRPLPGWGAAAAAAAGNEALARVLSVELAGAGVRVNTVRSGPTDTDTFRRLAGGADDATIGAIGATFPLGRLAQPEEVAAAALFLMANPYVTGTVVTVDGGSSNA